MNEKINKYLTRVSQRDFLDYELSQQEWQGIEAVINAAPTSTNMQQFSAIIIKDKDMLKWIGENNGPQPWIAQASGFILFVADRTRVLEIIDDKQPETLKKHDALRVVVDASIGATYTHDALLDMGFGVTFIGGVYNYIPQLKQKLNLPETTMPILGLAFGKAGSKIDSIVKINKVFYEKYDKARTINDLPKYNDQYAEQVNAWNPGGSFYKENLSLSGVAGSKGQSQKKNITTEKWEQASAWIGQWWDNFK